MKLRVSKAAADDLEGIWQYTVEHWSVEQADRYLNLILDVFDQIQLAPRGGKDFGHVRKGYLAMRAGSHLIFYRLDDPDGVVEIIRVLHGRMDLDDRLAP